MTDEEFLDLYSDWLNEHYTKHFFEYVGIPMEEYTAKQFELIDRLRDAFEDYEVERYGVNKPLRHNAHHTHMTREIRTFGECAACDEYHLRQYHEHH